MDDITAAKSQAGSAPADAKTVAQLEQQLEGQITDARQRNGLAQMLASLPVRLWHSRPSSAA